MHDECYKRCRKDRYTCPICNKVRRNHTPQPRAPAPYSFNMRVRSPCWKQGHTWVFSSSRVNCYLRTLTHITHELPPSTPAARGYGRLQSMDDMSEYFSRLDQAANNDMSESMFANTRR